jgi:ribose transport system permease protein
MIEQPATPQLGHDDAPVRPAFTWKVGTSKELGIFILLVVLCAFVSVMSHGTFLHADNLQNTSQLIGLYGIFSIGAGIVIITGGIDLSVGSLFALFGVLLSMMLTLWHWPWPLAVLAVLGGGALIGAFHGFLITRVGLQPFIVTLCGLLFYRGIARFIAGDGTMGFGEATGFKLLQELATGSVLGVPVPFVILLVVAVIMGVVLHKSIYGRYLYAVGRNEEAARYSGVNTRRIIAGAYIISGTLAGLAAILIAFYTNSISPSSHGQSYELYGIAAAVLGGCSLRGGEGSIVGILIGAALLQVLQNLVNLLNIPSSLNFAVVGAVILLGVITDQLLKKKGKV